jgi:hypothetical protein
MSRGTLDEHGVGEPVKLDQAGGRTSRLRSRFIRRAALDDAGTRELFCLLAHYYDHVDFGRFSADLAEKDYVILLEEADTGIVRGFSTQKVLRARVHDTPVFAIFSGDTIIDRAFWGEQELVRAWCRFAGALREETTERLFWFLISKGYRTYLYLPLFFEQYFPRFDAPTPPFEQAVMDTLAELKFPEYYRRESGLLVFSDRRGNLTPDLAVVPVARQRDPRVRFFLSRNPDYALGTELVCLAEVSTTNMRSVARRALAEGGRLGSVDAVLDDASVLPFSSVTLDRSMTPIGA